MYNKKCSDRKSVVAQGSRGSREVDEETACKAWTCKVGGQLRACVSAKTLLEKEVVKDSAAWSITCWWWNEEEKYGGAKDQLQNFQIDIVADKEKKMKRWKK